MTDESPITTGPGEPIYRLEMAQVLRSYHHNALWEAERHFTWLTSIVLSAAVIIATSDKVGLVPRLLGAAFLAAVGAVICLIALTVVKRERSYFARASRVFLEEYNRCFPTDIRVISEEVPAGSFFAAVKRVLSGAITVREAFQLLFVLLFAVFAIVIVTACGVLANAL